MRVAIGGFAHETNTFNPAPTTLERIRRDGEYLLGHEIVRYFRGTRATLAGIIAGCEAEGIDFVPTFFAEHGPSTGLLAREVIEHVREQIVAGVRAADAEGVLLYLHGAAAADGFDDPEAAILGAVREAIGDRPLVVVYDLHANIGTGWVRHANAIIGYKTAPHTDQYDRGTEGAHLIARTLRSEVRPVVRMAKPPILVKSGLMSMTDAPLALIKPPMFWLMSRARELERQPGVLNVSVAAGFGDTDVPVDGMKMLATTDNDPALAERCVGELSDLAWKLRQGFLTDLVLSPVEMAVSRAVASENYPVILADQGNNTAGGSPGDGTAILAALGAAGWPDAALFIRDAESARAAAGAGVGAPVRLTLGAKLDRSSGSPVDVEGTVRLIADGRFVDPHFGLPVNLGATAVVRCGATDVVVTENPSSQIHPAFFRAVGIEPAEKRILVVQSAHLFRDEFEVRYRIPRMIIEVDSPGITNPDARRFSYRHIRRPIFPLDPDAVVEEAARTVQA